MSKELIGGLLALLGVLVAGLLNTRNSSKSWLRQERLEAYREYSTAALALVASQDSVTWRTYNLAHDRILVTATLHQSWRLRLLKDAFENLQDFTSVPRGFHEEFERLSARLFRETQLALGVRVRLSGFERIERFLDYHAVKLSRVLVGLATAVAGVALLWVLGNLFDWYMGL